MGKRPEQTLLQGGHTEGPGTYEIPPHTCENGHHKQIDKQQVLARLWRKGNPSAPLVGIQTGAATVENSMEFPQKTNMLFNVHILLDKINNLKL